MMMRRILPCVLVLGVLVMTGCDFLSDSNSGSTNSNSNAGTQTPNTKSTTPSAVEPINWKAALDRIKEANGKFSPEEDVPTAKEVLEKVRAALRELGDVPEEKCKGCQPNVITAAKDAQRALKDVESSLQSSLNNPISAQLKQEVITKLNTAKDRLEDASAAQLSSTNQNANIPGSNTNGNQPTGKSIWDYVIIGLAVAGGLVVLVLIGMGVMQVRNQSRQHLEHHLGKGAAAHASITREAQKEILEKLSSLSSAQNDTSTRLHDVHTEIRNLARLVRESSVSRGDGRSYASIASSYSYNDPPPPKEEPEFPVSAVDYLDKMTRFSNVVKPDFQNGILINDPDGTGELMLIRDSRLPDETQPLFVVPRHAQFQTKQDFYTYYEKYYECVRPSAGNVWIIDPAVVEKVSGGWQLREKGLLEIRS